MAFLFYKFTGTVTFQWVRIVIAAFGDQQTIKRSQCSEKALQTSSSPPGRFDSSSFEPTSVFADRNDTFHFLGEKKRKHRQRSEERREGKECVRTCRSRWVT